MPSQHSSPLARVLMVLLLFAVPVACSSCTESVSSTESSTEPTPASGIVREGYVGRDACVSCHEDNSVSYMRTGMGRSLYPMTSDRIIEDWTKNNIFVEPSGILHYRMTEHEGEFFQEQFLLDENGSEIAAEKHRLVYAIGSANHGRGYLLKKEGKLFQAPICWDPTMQFWMYCPGFETKNEHFNRETSYTCLFCHNGRVNLVEGERNLYHEPFSEGIGCERCHGPGEKHVDFRKAEDNFWAVSGEEDKTIVNPGRLGLEERKQVCFQCHLGDTSATVRVFRENTTLEDFRPGQKITDVLVPFRFVEPSQYDFGLVAQADRMLLSKCYTESNGKLECLTCHNPHITVYSKEPGSFRDNCMICHQQNDCIAPAEKRAGTAVPDDCVACHMRKAISSDRRYAPFTDHWIRRNIDIKERDSRTNYDLEPIFKKEFAKYSKAEQHYYTGRANFLRALKSSPTPRRLMLQRAREAFEAAVEAGHRTVDSWFFLGKTYMYIGRWAEAEQAFRHTVELDPLHHDGNFALGQSLTSQNKFTESNAVFTAMLERDADDPMALAEKGRSLVSLGKPDAAIEAYRRAVAAEPWNATLHLNLGMTLASTGQFAAAVKEGEQATRLDPNAPWIWDFYANALQAAGQEAQALAARRQAQRMSK